MVSAIIFAAHLIFALIIFTKKWQTESTSSAFLNLGLIAILFSVGWSITGMLSNLIMGPKGFGILFDRDAFSLTVLSIVEYFFYKMYYKGILTEVDTEKQ
jgi:uncharacterized membrane protein YhdT